MEEQNRENRLQFLPQPLNWMAHNASGLYIDRDANQHYTMTPGVNGIYPEIVPVPQWVHPPQIPQNYVEFLAERGYPEISKQVPYDITKQVPSSRLVDPPQLEEYPRPHNERNFVTAFTGSEHQPGIQKQNRKNEESSNAFQAYSGSGAASSKGTSEARQKRSREKAIAADRRRRLRISHGLDALRDLVPHSKEIRSKEAGKMALLDGVIDHVKYLQCQLKDLCQNRLGGEPISNSLIFFEGHGHYILKDQMLSGPLEEVMGKLIDFYPSAATELLQSRGLIVMPMTYAEELIEPTEMMLGMQEKCPFMTIK
ncbi:hypothetical protein ACP275_04G027100 [Erythranthe tilingii]